MNIKILKETGDYKPGDVVEDVDPELADDLILHKMAVIEGGEEPAEKPKTEKPVVKRGKK